MTFLVPKLFRNTVHPCFNGNCYSNCKEPITTIALGALTAGSLYSVRKVPLAGFAILLLTSYLDAPSSICGAGFIATYYASRYAKFCKDYYKTKHAIPLEYSLPALTLAAIAWYCFQICVSYKKGLLRYSTLTE